MICLLFCFPPRGADASCITSSQMQYAGAHKEKTLEVVPFFGIYDIIRGVKGEQTGDLERGSKTILETTMKGVATTSGN